MGLFDGATSGLVEQLEKSEAVQQAMGLLKQFVQGHTNGMKHFNDRLSLYEETVIEMKKQNAGAWYETNQKLDKILIHLGQTPDVAPAADDGLLQLLADSGEEMQMQEIQPLPPSANNNGEVIPFETRKVG